MPKKKDSVALFEVIAKSRQKHSEAGMEVPTWMGQEPAGEPAASQPAPAVAPRAFQPMAAQPVPKSDSRMNLSLSYVSSLMLALVVVLAIVLAFWLGRWSVKPVATLTRQTPAGLPAPPMARQSVAPAQPAAPAQPVAQHGAGRYHLIIQGLRGMAAEQKEAADKIKQFLQQEGVMAEVGIWPDPRQYVVWSKQGFDSQTGDDVLAYMRQIEALGQRYKAEGGKYDFRQRDRDGRPRPWFGQFANSQ